MKTKERLKRNQVGNYSARYPTAFRYQFESSSKRLAQGQLPPRFRIFTRPPARLTCIANYPSLKRSSYQHLYKRGNYDAVQRFTHAEFSPPEWAVGEGGSSSSTHHHHRGGRVDPTVYPSARCLVQSSPRTQVFEAVTILRCTRLENEMHPPCPQS
jgi:hypothetical protein